MFHNQQKLSKYSDVATTAKIFDNVLQTCFYTHLNILFCLVQTDMAFRFSSLLFVKKGVYLPKREPTSEGEEKKEKVLLADAMRSTILVSGRLNPT